MSTARRLGGRSGAWSACSSSATSTRWLTQVARGVWGAAFWVPLASRGPAELLGSSRHVFVFVVIWSLAFPFQVLSSTTGTLRPHDRPSGSRSGFSGGGGGEYLDAAKDTYQFAEVELVGPFEWHLCFAPRRRYGQIENPSTCSSCSKRVVRATVATPSGAKRRDKVGKGRRCKPARSWFKGPGTLLPGTQVSHRPRLR